MLNYQPGRVRTSFTKVLPQAAGMQTSFKKKEYKVDVCSIQVWALFDQHSTIIIIIIIIVKLNKRIIQVVKVSYK